MERERRRVQEERPGAGGFWPWFLHRLTAVLLAVLLAVHLWLVHFSGIGEVAAGRQEELVLFELVRARLKQALFISIDLAMLALVLYHGLNGVRNILLEWRPVQGYEKTATAGLIILGVAVFVFGVIVLLAFTL
jgi:succinate dehydrogenase hydrophobic anchor subunit